MILDKRKFNGGNKNAGRKPKAEEIKLIERLSPMANDALKALHNGVKDGDFQFVKLYLEYYAGKPSQQVDITSNGKDININPITWIETKQDL